MPVKLVPPRPVTSDEADLLSMIVLKGNILINEKSEAGKEIFTRSLHKSLSLLPLDLHLWICQEPENVLYKLGVSTYASMAIAIKENIYDFNRVLELNYNEDRLLEELI